MLKCPHCNGRLRRLDSRDSGVKYNQVHMVLRECVDCRMLWISKAAILGKWPKRYLPRDGQEV